MKFLVKDLFEESVKESSDPAENSTGDNSVQIEELNPEEIALDRVSRAPLNQILIAYYLEKDATDIQ